MNTHDILSAAPQRLHNAPEQKKIVLIYAGILTGLAALTTLIGFLLSMQIGRSGGLSNLGTRSVLSTIQTLLPIAQTILSLCLALGYRSAMLRIARGQYASPQSLRLGFDRFWVLLRCTLIQALLYLALGMVSMYLSIMIFVFSPLSRGMTEILTPLVESVTALNPNVMIDEALYAQLLPTMRPLMVIFILVFAVLAIPVILRYRMAEYVIIDRPGFGALAALRESRAMMRYNKLNLVKLDLRLWWYYLSLVGASLLCYGDQLLLIFGVELPFSADIAYYAFYVLYLGVQFAIYYFLCNRIEVTYALAYESIRPQEENSGVVLGNIFQM